MRKLLLNTTPLFRKLRQLSMLLTLLLALPQTAWGDEVTKAYTFTGTTLSGNAGTATSDITGGAVAETYTWNIKDFNRVANGYAYNDGTVTPNNLKLGFSGKGISRKSEYENYHAVKTTFVLESEAFTGEFVSATIEGYTSTGMSTAKVQVLRDEGTTASPLSYDANDDLNYGYTNLSSTTSLPMSTLGTHSSNKYLNGNKLRFMFMFVSDNQSDNASFEIGSITITTKTTNYNLTVAGTQVTSDNKRDILTGSNEGKVSYDPNTNTLTLNGAEITGGIVYSGAENLTIALKGTNSINNTNGPAINTQAATSASGTIKIIKASDASSAELTATCGSGGSPIDTNVSTLGSGLYWKPIARETMVITEDPNFVIIEGTAIADGSSINGTSGSLIYNASDKTLTLNGYEKDFGSRHAIKTGVSGLKVKLIGASTINCSADSAVFYAFSSSASIQFIKDDATSKLTMTGTDFDRFAANSVTYDGFIYYSSQTTKGITQAAAPELGKLPKVDAGSYYTFATIDYAASDKSGSDAIYKDASPVLKYSFDYADSQKQDVSDQTYPAEGIKMTDPGILTAWVEVGTYKGPEAKGVRFGFIENPIEMEFNGTEKQINVTPAPTMTNAVTPSVSSDYSALFNNFGTLDAANKITIKSCYDDKIGFIFNNSDVGYTSLNDSTLVTFKITPPKPTISVPGGTYDAAQTVSIVSNYQGTGATIKYYFDPTAEQTYSADLSITETKTLTAWVEVNGVKSDTVQAPYTIRQAANLSYSATSATANIHESSITFTPPTLSNPSQVAVTYSSSNTAVATINTTGDVTIVGAGVTTISAKPTDETLYIPTPATYELTVTRDFNNPFANQPAEQIYATYYNGDEDLTLPDGITAYVITGISGNTVTTTATGYLPHEVPVLLEKTGNVGTTITGYTGSTGNFSSNLLKYAEQTFSSTGKEYVLYMNEFVKATGNIPGSRCYLDLSSVNPSRGMYGIGDGTTSIRELRMENEGRDEWYDLQGRRIEQPTKAGLYIKNGKKVIVNIK